MIFLAGVAAGVTLTLALCWWGIKFLWKATVAALVNQA